MSVYPCGSLGNHITQQPEAERPESGHSTANDKQTIQLERKSHTEMKTLLLYFHLSFLFGWKKKITSIFTIEKSVLPILQAQFAITSQTALKKSDGGPDNSLFATM